MVFVFVDYFYWGVSFLHLVWFGWIWGLQDGRVMDSDYGVEQVAGCLVCGVV